MIVIGKFRFIIPKGLANEILSEFSFNVTKDLKDCKLDEKKLRNLILEDAIDKNTNLIGNLLYGSENVGIRKIRLSKGNNKGKREGYRIIAYVLRVKNTAYILHIYDKKKKTRLSKREKDNLKLILKRFSDL